LSVFNDDGNIKNRIFVNFDENKKIKDYKQKEKLPDKSTIFDKMFDFRNIILDKDNFGEVFNTFKTIMAYNDKDANL
jgi:hypothetical protein